MFRRSKKSTNDSLRRPPRATVFYSTAASGQTTRWRLAEQGRGPRRRWGTYLSRDPQAASRSSAIFELEKSILTSTTRIRFSTKPPPSAARSNKRDGKLPKTAWILPYDLRHQRYDGQQTRL